MRGQTIGLSESTVQKLLQDWKQKYNRDLRRPREWACEAILKTQIYAPSAADADHGLLQARAERARQPSGWYGDF